MRAALVVLAALAGCATAPPTFLPSEASDPLAAAVVSPLATAPLAAAKPKNLPVPGVEFVATPGTTAKAVVAYQAACVRFCELLQIHNPVTVDLPVPEGLDENDVPTGEPEAWADLQTKRSAVK